MAARQAVAAGDVAAALDAWAEAIRIAQADPSSAPAEIFEQRCREARRGPGVLQVRSLLLDQARSAGLSDPAIHWIAAPSYGVLGQELPAVMVLVAQRRR